MTSRKGRRLRLRAPTTEAIVIESLWRAIVRDGVAEPERAAELRRRYEALKARTRDE